MKFKATSDNVIIKVTKKIKSPDELLVDDGQSDKILVGSIVASGPKVHSDTRNSLGTVCVYPSRVAVLPWETPTDNFYVVKEENIYGIME
jgi:hypothetical protein